MLTLSSKMLAQGIERRAYYLSSLFSYPVIGFLSFVSFWIFKPLADDS